MTKAHREEVFIIDWLSLPKEWQDFVTDRLDNRMTNGALLKWYTEFEPYDEKDFQETLTMKQVEEYYKDQSDTNGFVGSLDDFIEDYGLEFEIWMIEQNYDLTGIKNVYFNVWW